MIIVDRDIYLVLLGASIALIASLLTAILQHILSLRVEKKKMEWEEKLKQQDAIRKSLLPTSTTFTMTDRRISDIERNYKDKEPISRHTTDDF